MVTDKSPVTQLAHRPQETPSTRPCVQFLPSTPRWTTNQTLKLLRLFRGLLRTLTLFLPVTLSSVFSSLDALPSTSADFKYKELLFFIRFSSSSFISIVKDPFSQLFNSICLEIFLKRKGQKVQLFGHKQIAQVDLKWGTGNGLRGLNRIVQSSQPLPALPPRQAPASASDWAGLSPGRSWEIKEPFTLFVRPPGARTSCSPPATGSSHWQSFLFHQLSTGATSDTFLILFASPWKVFSLLSSQHHLQCLPSS